MRFIIGDRRSIAPAEQPELRMKKSVTLRHASVRPDTLEYAIWLDELGEVEDHPKPGEVELIQLNVGSALASKRAAIAAHVSQTTDLIADDPAGFRLTPQTIARLTQSTEVFLRPINESH
jgi:hypothetical protein